MGTFAILAAFLSLIGIAVQAEISTSNNERTLEEQKKLQEDAQEFNAGQQELQNEYQQQMHEFNLVNDPKLQFQGLKSVGLSDAAVVQAIAGSPSTGFSPTASNAQSGIAAAPNFNSGFSPLEGLNDLVNRAFEAEKTKSETDVNKQEVVFSKKMCEESNARMVKIAHDMHIDDEHLHLAQQLNDAMTGLYQSERDLNLKRLDEISSTIQLNFAKIQNLDAQTISEYVLQSKYKAETNLINAEIENVQTDTFLKSAQINFIGAQTEGQNIFNLDSSILLELKKARYEVSKSLGVDIDSDIVTQYLMAVAQGNGNSLIKLLGAVEDTGYSVPSTVSRNSTVRHAAGSFRSSRLYSKLLSPSMQPHWNPVNSGTSFRW